jgi:hypothetical protein
VRVPSAPLFGLGRSLAERDPRARLPSSFFKFFKDATLRSAPLWWLANLLSALRSRPADDAPGALHASKPAIEKGKLRRRPIDVAAVELRTGKLVVETSSGSLSAAPSFDGGGWLWLAGSLTPLRGSGAIAAFREFAGHVRRTVLCIRVLFESSEYCLSALAAMLLTIFVGKSLAAFLIVVAFRQSRRRRSDHSNGNTARRRT